MISDLQASIWFNHTDACCGFSSQRLQLVRFKNQNKQILMLNDENERNVEQHWIRTRRTLNTNVYIALQLLLKKEVMIVFMDKITMSVVFPSTFYCNTLFTFISPLLLWINWLIVFWKFIKVTIEGSTNLRVASLISIQEYKIQMQIFNHIQPHTIWNPKNSIGPQLVNEAILPKKLTRHPLFWSIPLIHIW